jgi:plastocyanin
MNKNIIGIVVALVVAVGGWYMLRGTPASAPMTVESGSPTAATGTTIIYSDQGFSPASLTVPLGTTITFVNQSSRDMWVASAMHPGHTAYSGTSLSEHCPDTTNTAFDECTAVAAGNSFSFTFNKEGTWKYHNHTYAADYGAVVVTAAAVSN